MAKLLENEKFRKKFYKYAQCGNLKKLNALLNEENQTYDKEYLESSFLQGYINSKNYNGDVLKRIVDIPSIYIDARFNENFIFNYLYKRDREIFFYAFEKGKLRITESLVQKIFEDDRKFFLKIIEVDNNLGRGILNDLIKKNDLFAHDVIEVVNKFDKAHLENALSSSASPDILENLLKKDKQNFNFDNHQSGLITIALKNLENDKFKGEEKIEQDIEKLKIICDNAQVGDEEYQEFYNGLVKISTTQTRETLFPLLKTSGACNKLIEKFLEGKVKETSRNINILSFASDNFTISNKTVKLIFERGDFSKASLISNKLKVNLNDYNKDIVQGLNGLIKRLEVLGDEKISRLADNLLIFARQEKLSNLDGEYLVGCLDEVEKTRDDWKRGLQNFKFSLYTLTNNYGKFSGKVVGDALVGGGKWYFLLNKNINLNKESMQQVVWGIIENNCRYGFNKKLLEKVFKLNGFSLNSEQANSLLFEGAINIFDENKNNDLLQQKKYFNFLINNEKIKEINGINWAYILKQKGVKQNDDIYQKVLLLANANFQETEEE